MDELEYEETEDTLILTSDGEGEWVESDSVVVVSDWA